MCALFYFCVQADFFRFDLSMWEGFWNICLLQKFWPSWDDPVWLTVCWNSNTNKVTFVMQLRKGNVITCMLSFYITYSSLNVFQSVFVYIYIYTVQSQLLHCCVLKVEGVFTQYLWWDVGRWGIVPQINILNAFYFITFLCILIFTGSCGWCTLASCVLDLNTNDCTTGSSSVLLLLVNGHLSNQCL